METPRGRGREVCDLAALRTLDGAGLEAALGPRKSGPGGSQRRGAGPVRGADLERSIAYLPRLLLRLEVRPLGRVHEGSQALLRVDVYGSAGCGVRCVLLGGRFD
jgi:hypothetical protein